VIDVIQGLAGRTLGQYELSEIIGRGGMGVVYRAYQPSLRRDVAIKLVSPALSNQQGYIDQFLTEARTAAALEHPHIVPVYDSGVYEQVVYVVMRLLPGGSLAQRMVTRIANHQPPYPLADIAALLKVMAGALDYAHSQGVIHRDIKASNILFDKHDNLFLTDFGIARALPHSVISTTQHDGALGTPLYMSPEQWRDEVLTPASDQYALGVVVYYLVTGRMPFDAATPYALMYQHINETPAPPERWRRDVPEALGDVMERVLAKVPNERFASATAFALAFEQALHQPPQPKAMWDPEDMDKTNIVGQPPNYQQPPPRYGPPPVMPPGPPAYNPPRTQYLPLPQRRFTGKWILLAGLAAVMLIAGGIVLAVSGVVGGDGDQPGGGGGGREGRLTGPAAYVSNQGGNWDIYTADESGGAVNRVTTSSATDWQPAWSASGVLAFVSDRDGNSEIYTAAGGNLTRLTQDAAEDLSPAWSADGSLIVFESNRDGNSELYMMNADGSSIRRLTNTPNTDEAHPGWSPDGAWIVCEAYGSGGWALNLVDPTSGAITVVTPGGNDDRAPSWSPDGNWIAFQTSRDGNPEIYVINVYDGTVRRLTNDIHGDFAPTWTPDGRIVFQSDRKGNMDLYRMNADGSGLIAITTHPDDETDPAWRR